MHAEQYTALFPLCSITFVMQILRTFFITCSKIPGARSLWRLNSAHWRPTLMVPQYGTCCTSAFWPLEFRGIYYIFRKFVPSCSSYLRVSAVQCYLSDCQDALATRKFQTKFRMSIAHIARERHLYVTQILHPPGHPVTSPQNGHVVHSSHGTPITTRLWTPALTANKAMDPRTHS